LKKKNPLKRNKKSTMKIIYSTITLLICCLFSVTAQNKSLKYLDTTLSFDIRVEDLVSRLTLEEKVTQMSNQVPAIDRLQVPAFNYQGEALHGLAETNGGKLIQATSFPQSIAIGSTWNPQLMQNVANAISDEARAFYEMGEMDISFWSPNINVLRDPRWGRNDEAYSEDPYLMSKIAVAFVKGLQGEHPKYLKTIAAPKHFVANNSEFNRHDGNSEVEERWLREYYFPAYKASIQEGGAFSVMCAYNRVNGVPACGNEWLLTTILRKDWGFQGYVVSDCGAIMDIYQNHKYVDTPQEASALAVKAGCELNCGSVYSDALLKAVKKGLLDEKYLDTALKRLFLARYKLGLFAPKDEMPFSNIPEEVIESKEHQDLALQAAREGIVLLKNQDNALPLSKNIKSLAVIGPNADNCVLGSYSGAPSRRISALQGIKDKLGSNVNVFYEKGCNIQFKDKINFSPGEWGATSKEEIYATALEELEFKMLYEEYLKETKEKDEILIARAVELAKKVEHVVLVMGTNRFISNEEADAENLNWPGEQGKLIKEICAVNPNVTLVTVKGFQINMTWEDKNIPAIVEAWYAGQEQGHAIADVLFGDYNPGGKLPVTYYKSENDLPHIGDYDITKGRTYWFFNKEALYPFGYGLSYTNFDFKNLKADKNVFSSKQNDKIEFSLDIKNTGRLKGDEVVQLYIKDLESSVIQPIKKLRAFNRVSLKKGETKTVNFILTDKDFNFWDEKTKNWNIEPGKFEIQIGASSQDIKLKKTIEVF
jgi:beta-glucosidase